MPQPTDSEILDMIRQSLSAGQIIKIIPLLALGKISVSVQSAFTTVASAKPTLEEALRASIESANSPIMNVLPT